jgi:hypothetical protein
VRVSLRARTEGEEDEEEEGEGDAKDGKDGKDGKGETRRYSCSLQIFDLTSNNFKTKILSKLQLN